MTFAIALFLAAANLCTVPAPVQKEIIRRFPNYQLPPSAEAHCPYVVRADFDCDKTDDYALLIVHAHTGRVLLVTSLATKKGNLIEVHRAGNLGAIGTAHVALASTPKVKGARCKAAIAFGDKLLYRVGNDWKVSGNPTAGKP